MKLLLLLIAIFLTGCSGDKLVLQCFEEPKDKAFYTLLTFDLNTNSSWIEEFWPENSINSSGNIVWGSHSGVRNLSEPYHKLKTSPNTIEISGRSLTSGYWDKWEINKTNWSMTHSYQNKCGGGGLGVTCTSRTQPTWNHKFYECKKKMF